MHGALSRVIGKRKCASLHPYAHPLRKVPLSVRARDPAEGNQATTNTCIRARPRAKSRGVWGGAKLHAPRFRSGQRGNVVNTCAIIYYRSTARVDGQADEQRERERESELSLLRFRVFLLSFRASLSSLVDFHLDEIEKKERCALRSCNPAACSQLHRRYFGVDAVLSLFLSRVPFARGEQTLRAGPAAISA